MGIGRDLHKEEVIVRGLGVCDVVVVMTVGRERKPNACWSLYIQHLGQPAGMDEHNCALLSARFVIVRACNLIEKKLVQSLLSGGQARAKAGALEWTPTFAILFHE